MVGVRAVFRRLRLRARLDGPVEGRRVGHHPRLRHRPGAWYSRGNDDRRQSAVVRPTGERGGCGASAARCRGLPAAEDDAHFREALALHATVQDAFGAARTRLCLGERLRRAGRRLDAREEIRSALGAFVALGAGPWAERARTELQPSGATLRRRRAVQEGQELTPQERQIAAHVAQGKTNKEVAAALFLSHKTVDFHLGRVYRNLNLRSRGELIRRYAAAWRPAGLPAAGGGTTP